MSLSDATYRCGRALRRAGTHLHGLAETEGATPGAVRAALVELEALLADLRAALPADPVPSQAVGGAEVWDLDPAVDADWVARGWSGPYRAERAEVVAAAGRAILVAHIIRHGTPRVVRCERTRDGAWVIHRQIAEDVNGREADAFAEMLGYARTALEAHAAEEAARAAARRDGARCDGPTCPAPLEATCAAVGEDVECQDLPDRLSSAPEGRALLSPFGA